MFKFKFKLEMRPPADYAKAFIYAHLCDK